MKTSSLNDAETKQEDFIMHKLAAENTDYNRHGAADFTKIAAVLSAMAADKEAYPHDDTTVGAYLLGRLTELAREFNLKAGLIDEEVADEQEEGQQGLEKEIVDQAIIEYQVKPADFLGITTSLMQSYREEMKGVDLFAETPQAIDGWVRELELQQAVLGSDSLCL